MPSDGTSYDIRKLRIGLIFYVCGILLIVGYAHAKNRPTVHICSTSLNRLPFDVKTWNTILYKKGQTHALKKLLAVTLKNVVKC